MRPDVGLRDCQKKNEILHSPTQHGACSRIENDTNRDVVSQFPINK